MECLNGCSVIIVVEYHLGGSTMKIASGSFQVDHLKGWIHLNRFLPLYSTTISFPEENPFSLKLRLNKSCFLRMLLFSQLYIPIWYDLDVPEILFFPQLLSVPHRIVPTMLLGYRIKDKTQLVLLRTTSRCVFPTFTSPEYLSVFYDVSCVVHLVTSSNFSKTRPLHHSPY